MIYSKDDERSLNELERLMNKCEEQSAFLRRNGLYLMAQVIEAECAKYNREHYLIACRVRR